MVGNAVTKQLLNNGFNVSTLFDTDIGKCKEFPCEIARNPKHVTEESDVVITALPKPHHVNSVFGGVDGILAGISKNKIWIDHSTTDYEQTQSFESRIKEKSGHLLEAPITGGVEALKKGQMTTLVAGDKSVFNHVQPMLASIYQQVIYTGKVGTALIPKILSNIMSSMISLAAAESLMICKRAGIDLPTAFHAIRGSTGNSFVWETAVPMIFQGTYDPSFSIDLHSKDNQLVFDVARKHNVPIELLGHVQQIYNRGLAKYGPDAPCYIPAKLLEDDLGESLQCKEFKDWSYSIENIDGSAVIRHKGIDIERTGHEQPV